MGHACCVVSRRKSLSASKSERVAVWVPPFHACTVMPAHYGEIFFGKMLLVRVLHVRESTQIPLVTVISCITLC